MDARADSESDVEDEHADEGEHGDGEHGEHAGEGEHGEGEHGEGEGDGEEPVAEEWRGSEYVELVPLCHHVWSLAQADPDSQLDGGQLRPLMMMSGLPVEMLGTIWGMVDVEQQGKVRF